MPCEKYQDALTELAAREAEPTGDLRAHLAACASCRSFVEQEQSLFASIDSAMGQTANAPLSPALVQRFEARLAQQAQPKSASYLSSIYAGVAFAAALILLVLPHLRTRDASQHAVVPVAVRQGAARQPEGLAHLEPHTLAPMSKRQTSKPTSRPPKPEPEVLVPPDERIAFERFLSDLNGREDLAIALGKPMQEQRQPRTGPVTIPAPVEMPDLETIALVVQSLSEIADR